MPPAAYTSPALLDLELRLLFAKEWICVGRVEEVPQPGDYFTIAVADEPLLVVRSSADTIRVLSNVCRHKWSRIASGKGQVRRFVCPYHAWTYDLDGRLVHTRYMEGSRGFDASKVALPEVRSGIWRGFIYVNIDGDAPLLEEHRAELDERVGDYHVESMHLMCGDEEVWATNWKAPLPELHRPLPRVPHPPELDWQVLPHGALRARDRRRSLQLQRQPSA